MARTESKKETLKQLLEDEVVAALRSRPELVKIADGARDNWMYLETLPRGESVVEFHHAAEHLHAAVVGAYGENSAKGQAQFEKLRHLLRHDKRGVDKVIYALRFQRQRHPQRKVLNAEVKYFQRNRKRMRFAEAAERGLPIGSGVC
jgi:hypothetical protein